MDLDKDLSEQNRGRVGLWVRHAGFCLTSAIVVSIGLVEPANAQLEGILSALEQVIEALNGGIMRSLAIIAVILMALAWMFGFMDLRRLLWVGLGIAIIFGAAEVVDLIAGGGGA